MKLGLVAFVFGLLLGMDGVQAQTAAPAFSAAELSAMPRGNWATNGGSLSNQRYSPLTEINTENVNRLKAAWRTHLDGSGLGPQYSGEAQPIVYDGVIYIVTGADDVFAVSVKTGAILWKYEAHLDPNINTVCCGWTSRGVALGDGMVYVGQLDDKIVALDQKTGKVKWSIQAEKWQDGYTITSAPLYYNGLVISGFAGAEKATRGRVKAYNAKTGKLVWTFYTVPGPGEPGHESWPAGSDVWKFGGGNLWSTPAVDPEMGLIFFGTSNPGSDFNGAIREGDNLYTDSVVALEAKTGKYRWHYQVVHHDLWDYSLSNPAVLVDIPVNGASRKAVAVAGKTGWVYILDRVTGKPLLGIDEKPVMQDVRQKTAPTQPYPVGDAFVPQEIDIAPEGTTLVNKGRIFTPFWTDPIPLKPASVGGVTWPPSSVDPRSAHMFICASDRIQPFGGGDRDNEAADWKAGKTFIGASGFKTVDFPTFGVLSAIDLKTNRLVWQQRWLDQCYSGSAVTAGGVLFVGRSDGRMSAFASADGKKLWEFQTGAGVNAPPTVFEYEGRQYVAVLSAGNLFGRSPKGDSLWLFTLDGPMGPVPAARPGGTSAAAAADHNGPQPLVVPASMNAAEQAAARSEFDRICSSCHGTEGEGTSNGMALVNSKDGAKNASVIQQGRNGMPPFGDLLAPAEIGALARFVTGLPKR